MARIKTTTVLVNLSAQASVSTTVFDYEIPVLEAIHGQDLGGGFLQVVETSSVEVDLESGADLFGALHARYSGRNADKVRQLYPNRGAFQRALNACIVDEDDEDEAAEPQKAPARRGRKAAPKPAEESGDEDAGE